MDATLYPIQNIETLPPLNVKQQRQHRRVISKDGKENLSWIPEGNLVAHLVEHRAGVNFICVSRDCTFFLSGSDDGTIKVWDCQRLEKNVSNKSRLTYNQIGGRITALTFLENTHAFVSAAVDGSVHICKVDLKIENNNHKYSKITLIQKFEIEDGFVVALEHFNQGDQSILIFATSLGMIRALDLKTATILWTLHNPSSLGMITTMYVHRTRHFLVVGTSIGYISCFDLRFELLVQKWNIGNKGRIYKISPYPLTQHNWIIVAGGNGKNEISVWDLEKALCLKIFCVPEKEIKGWLENSQRKDNLGLSTFEPKETIRTLYVLPDSSSLMAAGSDLKIRYIDLKAPTKSTHVGKKLEGEPGICFKSIEQSDIQFFYEEVDNSAGNSNLGTQSPVSSSKRGLQYQISNHYDCITVLNVTEFPYQMLISASRSGAIKVWK